MRNPYLYPNGRIGALEKDLLPARTWQMLLSAADSVEAARLLADTWYGRFPGLSQCAFETVFEAAQAASEQELMELSEDQALVRGVLHRRDARNARYLWKDALCGGDGNGLELEKPGLVEHSLLASALADEETRKLLPSAMAAAAEELSSLSDPSPLEVDRILDRMAVGLELEEFSSMGPGFRRLLETLIDSRNVTTCIRFLLSGSSEDLSPGVLLEGGTVSREMLCDAALEGSLPDFVAGIENLERLAPFVKETLSSRSFLELERETERVIMEMLDAGSFELFGPAPLAAFIFKKEMEMNHLRILLAAKAAGMDRARLSRRLPRG